MYDGPRSATTTATRRFPLPRVTVTFWNDAESDSQTYADVIPDTGADLSVLPEADCAAIDAYKEAIRLDPDDPAVCDDLADALDRKRRESRGGSWLSRVLGLN